MSRARPRPAAGLRALRPAGIAFAAGLLVAGLGDAGCYRRVVGVKGPAADRYTVHEPALPADQRVPIVDDLGDLIVEDPTRPRSSTVRP